MQDLDFVEERNLNTYFDKETISQSDLVALIYAYVDKIQTLDGEKMLEQSKVDELLRSCFAHETRGEKCDEKEIISLVPEKYLAEKGNLGLLEFLHNKAVSEYVAHNGQPTNKKEVSIQGRKIVSLENKLNSCKALFQDRRGDFDVAKIALYDSERFAQDMASKMGIEASKIIKLCESKKTEHQAVEEKYMKALGDFGKVLVDSMVENEAQLSMAQENA